MRACCAKRVIERLFSTHCARLPAVASGFARSHISRCDKKISQQAIALRWKSQSTLARVYGLTVDNLRPVPGSELAFAHGIDVRAAAVRASLDTHAHRPKSPKRLGTAY